MSDNPTPPTFTIPIAGKPFVLAMPVGDDRWRMGDAGPEYLLAGGSWIYLKREAGLALEAAFAKRVMQDALNSGLAWWTVEGTRRFANTPTGGDFSGFKEAHENANAYERAIDALMGEREKQL